MLWNLMPRLRPRLVLAGVAGVGVRVSLTRWAIGCAFVTCARRVGACPVLLVLLFLVLLLLVLLLLVLLLLVLLRPVLLLLVLLRLVLLLLVLPLLVLVLLLSSVLGWWSGSLARSRSPPAASSPLGSLCRLRWCGPWLVTW